MERELNGEESDSEVSVVSGASSDEVSSDDIVEDNSTC